MKMKIKRSVLIMFNLATIIMFIVAVGDSQRNRKLYIEEQARNSFLISEINDRNVTIENLKKLVSDCDK